MRPLLTLLLFLIGGVGAGFITAAVAINNGIGPFSVSNGPWLVWPMAGTPKADPYTKAHFASNGEFPLVAAESLSFKADSDNNGELLLGDCTYAITGERIETRMWTLTVYDESARLIDNPAGRTSFNSRNVLRNRDDGFEIRIGPKAEPGNWIPTGKAGRVFVLLRLYNAEPAVLALPGGAGLPSIRRLHCE